MTAPRVQYARTADGVNVAFTTAGTAPGESIVVLPAPPFASLRSLAVGSFWFELARYRRIVTLDFRGMGDSERDVDDLSMEALLRDLEAVADHLRLDRFVLRGHGMSGPIAIAYIARHPERVSRLVLRDSYARAADMGRIPSMRGYGALLHTDWEMYLDAVASVMMGKRPGVDTAAVRQMCAEAIREDVCKRFVAATRTYDVEALLGAVAVPTLIINRPDLPAPTPEMLRRLAAGISRAQVTAIDVGLDAESSEREEARLLLEFLGEAEATVLRPTATFAPTGTAVILFLDIVDSTSLTESMGDAAFRAKARDLDEATRRVIRDGGGAAIEGKLVGDGVLATFPAAASAIAAALACRAASEGIGLRLHLGVHAGDVIREAHNIYGGAVNLAARIAAASAPGEILVSDTVRNLARTSAGVGFDDRGEHALKGVSEPQRLFAVRARA